jgi:hypothetical protein
MEKLKSYTDIEQSKKLAKILPIESADYFHAPDVNIVVTESYITDCGGERCIPAYHGAVPCWSLAALLGVLPNYQLQTQDDGIGILCSCNGKFNIVTASNPVDACVEMILKLNELNLL